MLSLIIRIPLERILTGQWSEVQTLIEKENFWLNINFDPAEIYCYVTGIEVIEAIAAIEYVVDWQIPGLNIPIRCHPENPIGINGFTPITTNIGTLNFDVLINNHSCCTGTTGQIAVIDPQGYFSLASAPGYSGNLYTAQVDYTGLPDLNQDLTFILQIIPDECPIREQSVIVPTELCTGGLTITPVGSNIYEVLDQQTVTIVKDITIARTACCEQSLTLTAPDYWFGRFVRWGILSVIEDPTIVNLQLILYLYWYDNTIPVVNELLTLDFQAGDCGNDSFDLDISLCQELVTPTLADPEPLKSTTDPFNYVKSIDLVWDCLCVDDLDVVLKTPTVLGANVTLNSSLIIANASPVYLADLTLTGFTLTGMENIVLELSAPTCGTHEIELAVNHCQPLITPVVNNGFVTAATDGNFSRDIIINRSVCCEDDVNISLSTGAGLGGTFTLTSGSLIPAEEDIYTAEIEFIGLSSTGNLNLDLVLTTTNCTNPVISIPFERCSAGLLITNTGSPNETLNSSQPDGAIFRTITIDRTGCCEDTINVSLNSDVLLTGNVYLFSNSTILNSENTYQLEIAYQDQNMAGVGSIQIDFESNLCGTSNITLNITVN